MLTTHKSSRIAALIVDCHGHSHWPAHYLGYFRCFNEGLFYEAHDVLEELWLQARKAPEAKYYQGLIQFAGAFVHLKKGRVQPAKNLFKLSQRTLAPYPDQYLGYRLTEARQWITDYLKRLDSVSFVPWQDAYAPKLTLPE
jgi:predicted metal-dependent hydrolase